MSKVSIAPRIIRLRDVPTYLGMDKNRFNKEVRPSLTEISIGKQGIAFDRLDLDAWVEQTKQGSGRPAVRRKLWGGKEHLDCKKDTVSGVLTKSTWDIEFAKVLKQVILRKQSSI